MERASIFDHGPEIDITGFKPRTAAKPAAQPEQVKAISETASFVSREPIRAPTDCHPRARTKAASHGPKYPAQHQSAGRDHRAVLRDRRPAMAGFWAKPSSAQLRLLSATVRADASPLSRYLRKPHRILIPLEATRLRPEPNHARMLRRRIRHHDGNARRPCTAKPRSSRRHNRSCSTFRPWTTFICPRRNPGGAYAPQSTTRRS